jgi:hypothetical protein
VGGGPIKQHIAASFLPGLPAFQVRYWLPAVGNLCERAATGEKKNAGSDENFISESAEL